MLLQYYGRGNPRSGNCRDGGAEALTGYLVLSTLHTNDAPIAIRHSPFAGLELPAHLLKATLNGVMAQRLLRTLCTSCRLEVSPDAGACQELVQLMAVSIPEVIYRPGGCIEWATQAIQVGRLFMK